MKKIILVLFFSLLLVAAMTACATPAKPDPAAPPIGASQTQTTTSPPSTTSATESPEESPAELTASQPLFVADAKRFLGTVEEFAVNEKGQTVLQMRRAQGSSYQRNLQLVLTENTKSSPEKAELANGSFLEVFYAGDADASGNPVEAIAINHLVSEDLYIYNGILVSVTADPDKKGTADYLLDPINENAMPYLFHCDETTQIHLDEASLKPGDMLHVLHSPAATRSIPPQSTALEISKYQAPEAGELPVPAAN